MVPRKSSQGSRVRPKKDPRRIPANSLQYGEGKAGLDAYQPRQHDDCGYERCRMEI